MLNQNCDFGAVFSPLQGQVLLRYGNLFRVPQKITCSEQKFRKIRPAGRIESNREKRLEAVAVTPDLSKSFCINPLIKITIQSKAPFLKGLYCRAVPNTAFERQTLPH